MKKIILAGAFLILFLVILFLIGDDKNREISIEDVENKLEKIDLIRVENPQPNQIITSPLTIQGEARGFWFFEGDFPVKLIDENGNVIARHYAWSKGEWMTEDFVPFESFLEFSPPASQKGTLILEKDNPSGLPEHYDELRIPVLFQF